jgi:hypothetical protein
VLQARRLAVTLPHLSVGASQHRMCYDMIVRRM